MVKKIDELKSIPRDPNSAESIEIKIEFWKKMSEQMKRTRKMIEDWQKEDHQNENK
jgi:hypothetical protein